MPDISMCDDNDCPFRKKCYRSPDSGTKPDMYQYWSFFIKHGEKIKPENCSGWIPLDNRMGHKKL